MARRDAWGPTESFPAIDIAEESAWGVISGRTFGTGPLAETFESFRESPIRQQSSVFAAVGRIAMALDQLAAGDLHLRSSFEMELSDRDRQMVEQRTSSPPSNGGKVEITIEDLALLVHAIIKRVG